MFVLPHFVGILPHLRPLGWALSMLLCRGAFLIH